MAKDNPDYDPFILENVFPDPLDALKQFPSLEELKEDCLFVLDTSVLISPFKVKEQSLNDIEKIYRELFAANRVYVPSYSLREFGKNRGKEIADFLGYLHDARSNYPTVIGAEASLFKGKEEHASLETCAEELQDKINEYKEKLNAFEKVVRNWHGDDAVSALYCELFKKERLIDHGKEKNEILSDRDRRIEHKIPPGYEDKSKKDRGIGDIIIWHSMLNLASREKKNVIFVSNDKKDDWVIKKDKEAIFPRFELINEFQQKTGHSFWLVNFSRFLSLAGAQSETVREIQETQEKTELAGSDYEGFISQMFKERRRLKVRWNKATAEDHYDKRKAEKILVEVVHIFGNRISSMRKLKLPSHVYVDLIKLERELIAFINRLTPEKELFIKEGSQFIKRYRSFIINLKSELPFWWVRKDWI